MKQTIQNHTAKLIFLARQPFSLALFSRHFLYLLLLLAGGFNVAAASPLQMPDSEINYPGASASTAFVAMEPYQVNIQGTLVTVPLWGSSRSHDFSGAMPFVNTATGKADLAQIQAWDPVFAASFTPPLSGSYNLNVSQVTNAGFPGRVDKQTVNNSPVTMVRYNAGDNITEGKCRSQLNAFAVPPRTHVRWELEVAFGNADGMNDWMLTPTGASPVLFWQMHSMNQSNPPLAANVDTDASDASKLMVTFFQRVGTATAPKEIGRIKGIPKNTMVPIVIEAFLDERSTADGGKGLLQISVNNTLVIEKVGPTLALGTKPHWWSMDMYLWNQPLPYPNTRASFWKTAKLLVFPIGAADTMPPSSPGNLAAIAPDSSSVNLSWNASTDNVSVAGYKIYRDGAEIGTSATTSFTDTGVIEGVTYNYTVMAYDGANNLSAASNAATISMPLAALNINSSYVQNITTDKATINWNTNQPTTGIIYYGTSSNNLNSTIIINDLATSHTVIAPSLSKKTKYYYKIVAHNKSAITFSKVSSFNANH
ncbi:MAG: fibronectin type III domain-containing protein [Methylovulum sp.]|nr:fibronectin type III domain-containing protein [Methylovulum sp.]